MPQHDVHTGYWIDHSKGNVLGATLTYDSNSGSQLISAATIVVQLASTAVWVLVAFGLHQYLCRPDAQDELDAQRRVLIRNVGPVSSTIDLIHLGHTWHGHAPRARARTFALSLIPALFFAGFTIAGIFVGQIAIGPQSSKALLKPGQCGFAFVGE